MRQIDFGANEDFIQRYQELKSSRKMAEYYNCDKTSVLTHAKKIGYNYSGNKEIKITNIPLDQVIKEYEELQSTEKVGQKHGCSGTAVRNYLISNGYKLKNYQAKMQNVQKEDFIADYEQLKSAYKMGKKYNCSSTTILNYAKKIGYDPNQNKEYQLSEKDKKEIIEAYDKESSTNLAKKYCVSRGLITKIWFDNNLLGKRTIIYNTAEKDITGQKFGLWTVLYKTDKRNLGGVIYWHCRCECGIEKDVTGNALRTGNSLSCGNHNTSKGNQKITEILQQANIPFEVEKSFSTCRDKLPLPFDFYVNNKYLIEYDGIQHYDPGTMFDYEYTHKHDLIKSQWCKDNNIPLIRIPYTHYKNMSLEDLLLETSQFVEK